MGGHFFKEVGKVAVCNCHMVGSFKIFELGDEKCAINITYVCMYVFIRVTLTQTLNSAITFYVWKTHYKCVGSSRFIIQQEIGDETGVVLEVSCAFKSNKLDTSSVATVCIFAPNSICFHFFIGILKIESSAKRAAKYHRFLQRTTWRLTLVYLSTISHVQGRAHARFPTLLTVLCIIAVWGAFRSSIATAMNFVRHYRKTFAFLWGSFWQDQVYKNDCPFVHPATFFSTFTANAFLIGLILWLLVLSTKQNNLIYL